MSGYNDRYQQATNGELHWYNVVPTRRLVYTETIAAVNWCEAHCGRSRYVYHYTHGYFFENQQHAFEFMLKWG